MLLFWVEIIYPDFGSQCAVSEVSRCGFKLCTGYLNRPGHLCVCGFSLTAKNTLLMNKTSIMKLDDIIPSEGPDHQQ